MQTEPQITFRDIPRSEAIENHILENIEQLEQISDKIIACRVVVEQSQKKQNQGKLYAINVILDVPRKEIVSNHKQDEDIYVAIRDAFNSVERMLKKYRRELKGEVKEHAEQQQGTIARIIPEETYGFISDATGVEYYFNEDNVHHPQFKDLNVGQAVHFIAAVGDDGMQAHRVTLAE